MSNGEIEATLRLSFKLLKFQVKTSGLAKTMSHLHSPLVYDAVSTSGCLKIAILRSALIVMLLDRKFEAT